MHDDIEALLFDLGGVIIDIDFDRVFQAWAEKSALSTDELKAKFSQDTAYKAQEIGKIDSREYCASLRNTLGLELSDDDILDGWNRIFIGMIPGIAQLLQTLSQKIPIYCFTNTNDTHRQEWQKNWGHELTYFNDIFISSNIGLRKPDKAAFDYVVQKIGTVPNKVLFFDDSIENIIGAKQAGLSTVHVKSTDDIRQACLNWTQH